VFGDGCVDATESSVVHSGHTLREPGVRPQPSPTPAQSHAERR
jgi:hypothetical protein